MKRTKKVGSIGRFGTRYGLRAKKLLKKVEEKQKQKHECPACKKMKLIRISAGIWECKSCKTKLAGGAYTPVSERIDTE